MSKQIEALKLALEALETGKNHGIAIDVLRRALTEQPAPPPECKTDAEKTAFAFGWWKALEENRKQPAQQQGPVAWRGRELAEDDWTTYWSDPTGLPGVDVVEPLYTSPQPSKPWVGLTEEERRACTQSPFTMENYLSIEAKLREKNNG